METLSLELPFYLYSENKKTDGDISKITYAADKLVEWADSGRGDAIENLCQKVYEQDVDVINAWKEEQFLLLEENWVAVEKGWSDNDNERQYEVACVAIRAEASDKCIAASVKMEERNAAIGELVLQSRKRLARIKQVPQSDGSSAFMFVLVLAGALTYFLL